MKQICSLTIAILTCGTLSLTALGGPEPLPSGKEMKEVAPAPLPECNWTGFYIGAHAGGQFSHSETFDLDGYNAEGQGWGYSESGFVGGGQVGYNFQWHWLVLGPEFDLGYMDLDGRGVEPSSRSGDARGESNSDFYATFRGRFGVALDQWLFYATGGGIAVNYDPQFNDPVSSPSGPDMIHAADKGFDWGYVVGGGIERMIGCHWSIKAEYLYFALDRQTFSGDSLLRDTFRFEGETQGHIVRAGLNYKF